MLTRLSLAWSRDGDEKFYVQDRMREVGRELWTWLTEGAHVYVCGDAKRMAKDVERPRGGLVARAGRARAPNRAGGGGGGEGGTPHPEERDQAGRAHAPTAEHPRGAPPPKGLSRASKRAPSLSATPGRTQAGRPPPPPKKTPERKNALWYTISIHDCGEICPSNRQFGFSDQTETWNKESRFPAIGGTIFLFFRRSCGQTEQYSNRPYRPVQAATIARATCPIRL